MAFPFEVLQDFKKYQGKPWSLFFKEHETLAKTWRESARGGSSKRVLEAPRLGYLPECDRDLYGLMPSIEPFELIICSYCNRKYKPAAFQEHLDLRHKEENGRFPSLGNTSVFSGHKDDSSKKKQPSDLKLKVNDRGIEASNAEPASVPISEKRIETMDELLLGLKCGNSSDASSDELEIKQKIGNCLEQLDDIIRNEKSENIDLFTDKNYEGLMDSDIYSSGKIDEFPDTVKEVLNIEDKTSKLDTMIADIFGSLMESDTDRGGKNCTIVEENRDSEDLSRVKECISLRNSDTGKGPSSSAQKPFMGYNIDFTIKSSSGKTDVTENSEGKCSPISLNSNNEHKCTSPEPEADNEAQCVSAVKSCDDNSLSNSEIDPPKPFPTSSEFTASTDSNSSSSESSFAPESQRRYKKSYVFEKIRKNMFVLKKILYKNKRRGQHNINKCYFLSKQLTFSFSRYYDHKFPPIYELINYTEGSLNIKLKKIGRYHKKVVKSVNCSENTEVDSKSKEEKVQSKRKQKIKRIQATPE